MKKLVLIISVIFCVMCGGCLEVSEKEYVLREDGFSFKRPATYKFKGFYDRIGSFRNYQNGLIQFYVSYSDELFPEHNVTNEDILQELMFGVNQILAYVS